ncbi:MAG: SRPBCC domain-containing protein [Chloroflexi bacterium]|nr:SRPBCC domain-containing protein [Chloroflexota bacterium]
MDPVFRALGDPSRRLLLDRLFERDGQTLGELCAHLPAMTRFGVMRHLAVLESAGIVVSHRSGREKRHYLNPVPIRLLHDRWISKYADQVVGRMSAIKQRLEAATPMDTFDHVYSVYIQASQERVWQAITDGDETVRYYYGTRFASSLEPGAALTYAYPDGSIAADGRILEVDPPRRLKVTFHARWDEQIAAEGPVEMSWVLEASGDATRLTVTTSGLKPGSRTAEDFAGGIVYIVSGLKTVLETGQLLAVGAPA